LAGALVQGDDVTIIDNVSTRELENLSGMADSRSEVIEGDVAKLSLPDIFDCCDYLFHQLRFRAFSGVSRNR
jgi:nucleoside-diphosphate-sugar epimerase